ncbi:MAG: hypothetical protein A3D31_01250 [Candidatus Fluviicola riflensis]|nr:MAG: hypothetical protein CHH17_04290 [Candidatus Fluviicola riflensis]OGS76233.1 MAG: hypothetical protein A3D31_01250 [Candidatus Fluviicola riflensis]OGS83223.1 MAG: hypothetical protein A2724_00590 [Fluviicola sp. RIFCSPHIGHO2_01_FULL_43_53]OGS83765.1 MAG: hypothetical protein A3E30_17855 [Fluviicola sp. RIFCSPHIGHO2_12_FULL_43_24]
MKNKGLTYGLIVVVSIVWYQVFMRVKSNFETDDALPVNTTTALMKRKIVKPDSFRLQANYRDPFTGKLASSETAPTTNPNQLPVATTIQPPKPKPEPVVIQWPTIKYYGLVRKTTSKDPRTLIAIDGYMYKVKQGEQVLDNVLVLKVTRDYVQIKYRKEVRTFEKISTK